MAITTKLQHLQLFRARAVRAFLETILVQAGLILVWLLFINTLHPFSERNNQQFVSLLYSLCSFFWCALRWRFRPNSRSRWKQFLVEMILPCVLVLETVVSINLFAILLGQSILSQPYPYMAALGCGFLFFLFRIGISLWRFWNRLRRTHLRWALTHAHLMVVVVGAGVFSTLLVGVSLTTRHAPLGTFFVLLFMIFVTVVVLALVLPPSALFSYLFARQTTRRIEHLAAATSTLRAGDYSVRVAVEGADEIAHLQSDFNVMAADFERTLRELQAERDNVAALLQARRELIASVSHEQRTPVARVRSYLESTLLGWDEQPPPSLRQDLHIMEQQIIRLQTLINDLFTLARMEARGLELRCIPTEVEPLVRRVVETMAPIAWRGSRVEVVADIVHAGSNPTCAMIDESRLEQVLQNLLHNGVRHTPPGGIVVVSVHMEPQNVVLQVKDTGEGIAEEELPHIWDRFYRTESTRTQSAGGAGLGLALAKDLTEAMGGTVDVESVPGEGTCFTLCLPRVLTRDLESSCHSGEG